MECNLNIIDRKIRLYFGATAFFAGLCMVAITYLNLVPTWCWIVGGLLAITGIGSLLSASYGICMLRSLLDR